MGALGEHPAGAPCTLAVAVEAAISKLGGAAAPTFTYIYGFGFIDRLPGYPHEGTRGTPLGGGFPPAPSTSGCTRSTVLSSIRSGISDMPSAHRRSAAARHRPRSRFKPSVPPDFLAAGSARTAAAAAAAAPVATISNGTLWGCLDAAGVAVERHPVGVPLPRGSAVWNQLYSDSFPLAVAQPRSTAEVAAAVRCALAAGVQVGDNSTGYIVLLSTCTAVPTAAAAPPPRRSRRGRGAAPSWATACAPPR